MNLDLTSRWIQRWEGRRSVAYDDATGETIRPGVKILGNPTIGVGLNLNTAAARRMIEALGLDFDQVISGAIALTDSQIDAIRDQCIAAAVSDARFLVPYLDESPDQVQMVLTDLSFNMGKDRLGGFREMLACANSGNWPGAAEQLRNSLWFHEVGPALNERGGADVAVLSGQRDAEAILSAS
ncbi:MAG: hypothetical protein ACLGPM_07780 [Acidobacteriota bacterium]